MLTICDLLDANDMKLYDCPKIIKPCNYNIRHVTLGTRILQQ